jgi:hypothetical protein
MHHTYIVKSGYCSSYFSNLLYAYFNSINKFWSTLKYWEISGEPIIFGALGSSLFSKSSILYTLNGLRRVRIGIYRGSKYLSWQLEQTYFFIFLFLYVHYLCCCRKQNVHVIISSGESSFYWLRQIHYTLDLELWELD